MSLDELAQSGSLKSFREIRECWLSEQISEARMIQLMNDNPTFANYMREFSDFPGETFAA